jgi:ferredoxin
MPKVEYLSYGLVKEKEWDVKDKSIFERAGRMELTEEEHGIIEVPDGDDILTAAESEGRDWSVKCRKGRCGRCTSIVLEGEVSMDEQEFLTDDEKEDGYRLPCVSTPETDVRLVYGAKSSDRVQDRVK